MVMKTHILFITGAAGYVGAMLCDQFSKRDDVSEIIALDQEECPELLRNNVKIHWITANTSDGTWQKEVRQFSPTTVIHTAWQIRDMYGRKKVQWKWNVEGAGAVFDFALSIPTVEKLFHFSTAAVYGAFRDNTVDRRFTEEDPLREKEYRYALEKQHVEENFEQVWRSASHKPHVFVLRPAAITGPRGRFMRVRFGLQSALSGHLKGNVLYRIISLMVSFVPATPWWVRQFIHEDDVTDIVSLFVFNIPAREAYEVFNITPPGDPVLATHMARAVGKKVLPIYPWMVRLAYFFFWHITRGKIPTSRGIWRFYSYPIVMNGEKISRVYEYQYKYSSQNAFQYTTGRYESYVPKKDRRRS
jgi:nucleoside-diphosphate-sugar epimerase